MHPDFCTLIITSVISVMFCKLSATLSVPTRGKTDFTRETKGPACKDCKQEQNEVDKIQVELVKQRILSGLGLESVPKYDKRFNMNDLPKPILVDFNGSEMDFDSSLPRDDQAILLATTDVRTTKRVRTVRYDLPLNVLKQQIHYFNIWVKSNGPTPRLRFYFKDNAHDKSSKTFVVATATERKGWKIYDLIKQVQHFLAQDGIQMSSRFSLSLSVDIEFKGRSYPKESGDSPFVTIAFSDVNMRRKKRSTSCTKDSKRCCLRPLTVNFREIGWDDFILQPVSIDTNVCTGDCDTVYPLSQLGFFRRLKQRIRSQQGPKRCCTGRKYTGVTMLYFDGEGGSKNSIRNMLKILLLKSVGATRIMLVPLSNVRCVSSIRSRIAHAISAVSTGNQKDNVARSKRPELAAN